MSDCIEWDKTRHKGGFMFAHGYGGLQVRLPCGKRTKLYAHRLAYCEANGVSLADIKGKVVRHKCDNRPCVNPDHLELGTHKDNMRDMVERGRSARKTGTKNGRAVLTESDVVDIRNRYKPRCKVNGAKPLAAEYGVTRVMICRVVAGKAWSHV